LAGHVVVPGVIARHPDRPDWGLGQVRSAVGRRVTVGFGHAGKAPLDSGAIAPGVLDDEPRDRE